MSGSIIKRLEALENRRPGTMILLCDIDGVLTECTIDEYKANPAAKWQKVIGGGSLADVDYLLKEIEALAHTMAETEV